MNIKIEKQQREDNMAQIEALNEDIKEIKEGNQVVESNYKVKKKTIELSQDVDKNINAIQEVIENSESRLKSLEDEWAEFKKPLETELKEHKEKIERGKTTAKRKVEMMNKMRQDIREYAKKLKLQQNEAEKLATKFSKIKGATERHIFTDRILDIIKQIQKQKGEISLVVNDIKHIQREINKAGARLKRTEMVADELVFQFSDKNKKSKDVINVQIYRDLTNLRQKFDDLIKTNEEIGKLERDIRDFDSRSYQLSTNVNIKNLEQLLQDLQQIKAENVKLREQLRR